MVFSAQIEVSDELELLPVFAIALSGCDLRCDFCITGAESWNPSAGEFFSASSLAEQAAAALGAGARTVMILGGEPTIHLPHVIEIVSELPDDAVLVWKTNGHCSARARELLDGLFDIWLVDAKFGNDSCGQRLAKAPLDYNRVVRENLLWAHRNSRLIVRHLLMPGHVDCCWKPVAEWLADSVPGVAVNLRTGFWPAWHSRRHPELSSTTTQEDAGRAQAIAAEYNLNLIQ
ncbi:MAG: radical SAM protein [Verrucomicrobiales bacterium]